MGRKKMKPGSWIISVRVTDAELENIREIMRVNRKSASNVMREAIRLFLAQTS